MPPVTVPYKLIQIAYNPCISSFSLQGPAAQPAPAPAVSRPYYATILTILGPVRTVLPTLEVPLLLRVTGAIDIALYEVKSAAWI